jgi:hypothetical protein
MRFHFFRPLHGWREFIHEIVIVVLGVMLALAGAQAVENFHQRAELRDAEDAMTSELRDDDLPQAYTRAAVYNCYEQELDAIEAAVAAGDRAKFVTLANAYRPVFRTWDEEAWKAALASQVLVNSGPKRMISWSSPYILIPLLRDDAKAESDGTAQLRARLSGEGQISAAQQDHLFQVISMLRRFNGGMSVSSLVFMYTADRRGLALTREQKRALLVEARQKYGSCVREQSPDQLNAKSQLNYLPRGVLSAK